MVGWPVVASDFCWFTSVYFWIGRFLFNFSFVRLLRHHFPSCSEQQIAADVATWLLYYILHALHQLTISPSGIAATRADMSLRMSVRPSIRLPRRSCRVKMAWYELHREYLWWFLDSFAFRFSAFFFNISSERVDDDDAPPSSPPLFRLLPNTTYRFYIPEIHGGKIGRTDGHMQTWSWDVVLLCS